MGAGLLFVWPGMCKLSHTDPKLQTLKCRHWMRVASVSQSNFHIVKEIKKLHNRLSLFSDGCKFTGNCEGNVSVLFRPRMSVQEWSWDDGSNFSDISVGLRGKSLWRHV